MERSHPECLAAAVTSNQESLHLEALKIDRCFLPVFHKEEGQSFLEPVQWFTPVILAT
jgi:hypothetical protein